MKKLIILISMGLITPLFVFSAPSLAEKMKGKILLAVEDRGKTYYVHSDGYRYQVTTATAQKIFEKLALGITNENLAEIPLKDLGINPEVTCSEKIVEKIVYVDKPSICDYSFYNSQINQLEKNLTSCKLGTSQTTIVDNSTAENLLKKEYGLKINNVKSNILDIEFLQTKTQSMVDVYKSGNYYFDGTYIILKNQSYNYLTDSEFKHSLLTRLFRNDIDVKLLENQVLHLNKTTNDIVVALLTNERLVLLSQVGQLENELERKLLEL